MTRLLIRSQIKSTLWLLLMTAWLRIFIPDIKTGVICISISGKVTIPVLKTNPDNIVKKILNIIDKELGSETIFSELFRPVHAVAFPSA